MNMKSRALLSVALVFSFGLVAQAAEDAGLPGDFLNFGAGARPLGMGRAFTAVADDVDALYWNPAGLSSFRSSQVEFQHSPLPVEGSEQYIAYAQPVYALGSIGIGVINLTSGNVPRIDANNSEIGSFDHRETGYLASYAQRFREKYSLGSTLKMVEKTIDGRSERGFGADAGGLYRMNERWQFGAMLRNVLPPSYSYGSEKETFPVILRAGAAGKFLTNHLMTALDLEKTLGTRQGAKWHLGVEGNVIENIFLRAGVDPSEISTGFGLRWRQFQFDYAAGFQDIGLMNRFSMKVVFGGYEVDVKASPRIFSPTGLNKKVTFKVRTTHRDRIVKWIMTIRDAKNEVIQSFEGYNAPPEILEWDGKTAQGQVVEPGRYVFRMMITDAKNRTEVTPVRSLTVQAPTPFEIEAK